MATIDLDKRRNKIVRSIGSAALAYKVHGFEDLKLNVNLGYDVLRSKYSEDVPALAGLMYTSNQKDGTGLKYRSTQKKHNYLLDIFANYDHTWHKHTVGLMAGYGWQHFWKNMTTPPTTPATRSCCRPSTASRSITCSPITAV